MYSWQKDIGISNEVSKIINKTSKLTKKCYNNISSISSSNQARVLQAFRKSKVGEADFSSSTGYGYNDVGREKIEKLYALIFGGENALVRPQIVSGTHAIACCLYGILRPNDKVLFVTDKPYETLQNILEGGKGSGSLKDYNINCIYTNLISETITKDINKIKEKTKNFITDKTIKLIYIQRSRGYSFHSALTIENLKFLIKNLKELFPNSSIFVDNCYGEFVEEEEPLHIGADIIAGSLIKNPGGSLAPTGGYIVGRKELINKVAARVTVPGLGADLGPSLGTSRYIIQGLFLAPHFVGEALKSVTFAAALFAELGFEVYPKYFEARGDIVQCIKLGSPELLKNFCAQIQSYSPIDSFVTPIPAPMPGYNRNVIMAGGTFIQGSSLELSADAPLVEPYAVFLQGGIIHDHSKIAISAAAEMAYQWNIKERTIDNMLT